MSGETEIEVSVVSEEDLDLENSRSSSTPADLLLQDKNGKSNCGLGNHHHSFSFDVAGKVALRPACNPQYTSFSISSILGRPESPPLDSTSTVSGERHSSDVDRTSPIPTSQSSNQKINSCTSPHVVFPLPTSLKFPGAVATGTHHHHHHHQQSRVSTVSGQTIESRNNNSMGLVGCVTSATSPPSNTFTMSPSEATSNPLLGHPASADLAMLSRYASRIFIFFFQNFHHSPRITIPNQCS